MDPSAFIFVGLAVAWAAYLIPKALEHHDAGARSRTVDKFSHSMRVLARREPVDRRSTRLVTGRTSVSSSSPAPTPAPPAPDTTLSAEPTEVEQTGFFAATIRTGTIPAQSGRRPRSSGSAARRRRRVLGVLLVTTALVGALVAGRVISAWWIAAPIALLVAWLVACRVMVKNERAVQRPARPTARRPVAPTRPTDTTGADTSADGRFDETAEVPAVPAEAPTGSAHRAAAAEPIASGDGWELVPVTLPTYVSKPAAPRTVSAIDLDSTGVWTSGRTAADSALAQQADAVRAAGAAPAAPADQRRHVSGA